MSIHIQPKDSKIVEVEISGHYTLEDQSTLQQALADMTADGGMVDVLVSGAEFMGWDNEGDWSDLSYMEDNDRRINRIAIVSDEKWRDQILMFMCASKRDIEVSCFEAHQAEAAMKWLTS